VSILGNKADMSRTTAMSATASLETPDRLGFPEAKTIVNCVRTNVNVELDAGTKTFASGLLPDLLAALRRSRKGDLVAVISSDPGIGPELEAWCRFTRNSLVNTAVDEGRTRWVLRYGEAPANVGEDRPVGSRLWLYSSARKTIGPNTLM
jgi:TusA-related sulfurtransferase